LQYKDCVIKRQTVAKGACIRRKVPPPFTRPQVRARTSRWGLGTSSARALRFDRTVKVFNKTVEPPDTDPAFDPEGDAAKIKADTAAKAEVCCGAQTWTQQKPYE